MAITRLSDIIEPSVFGSYISLRTAQLSALVQSGVVRRDAQLEQAVRGSGGSIFNVPFWNDLADTEANVSGDDPAVTATPLNITAGQDKAQKHFRNQTWGAADLLSAIIGHNERDPMQEIGDKVAQYWVRQDQLVLINSLIGLFEDNRANDGGDMINDIALKAAGSPTASNRVSATALLDTFQTMGDNASRVVAVAMHSVIANELRKQNALQFVPTSMAVDSGVRDALTSGGPDPLVPTFMGKRVIVDDGIPTASIGGQTVHRVFVFGEGAFAWGEGRARVPVEIEREALQGGGGGVEHLISRREYILHPRGVAWQAASQVGKSPTNAELATAANWNRVYERKLVRVALLEVNP